jgi:Dickkopf-like protein
MRRTLLLSALVLGWGGCVVSADGDYDCGSEESYDCYLEYSPGYGYSRVCDVVFEPVVCIDFSDDDDGSGSTRYRRSSSPDGAGGAAGGSSVGGRQGGAAGGGAGSGPDASEDGFDFPCERAAQCGTGLCIEGECFYGCEGDADCGTADRCVLVDTVSVCQLAEEPSVDCTRSAECQNGQVCLNAACHDSCTLTSDCSNELDRCVANLCVPDRRVVSECLLDRECADGQVCIDARCQGR